MSHKQALKDYREAMKCAKKDLARGKLTRAEFYLLRAQEVAPLLAPDISVERQAFVLHRLAEVAALSGDPMRAKRRFRESLKLSKSFENDRVGHARTCRDYGEFLRREGDTKAGRRMVIEAIDTLESIETPLKRTREELLVTEGFMARFDLNDPKRRDAAITTLHMVARQLQGYRKPAYERAVLRCLIEEVLPIYSLQRIEYIRRAVLLSLKLGDYSKAAEYAAMLGGKTPSTIVGTILK